jgi:hypothetical protein
MSWIRERLLQVSIPGTLFPRALYEYACRKCVFIALVTLFVVKQLPYFHPTIYYLINLHHSTSANKTRHHSSIIQSELKLRWSVKMKVARPYFSTTNDLTTLTRTHSQWLQRSYCHTMITRHSHNELTSYQRWYIVITVIYY